MKNFALFGIILVSFFAFSFSSTEWPNEPTGSTNLVDCDFSTLDCNGQLKVTNGSIVQQSNAPLSPNNVLQDSLPGTQSAGGANVISNLIAPPTELYFGIWWKMNADFEGSFNGANKMFWVRHLPYTNSFLGFYNDFKWYWCDQSNYVPNGTLNSHLPNSLGSLHFGYGFKVERNTWYRIEFYEKASTTISSQDGIVRWWINGQLAGDYTNVNNPQGRESYAWEIRHTWDGTPGPRAGGQNKDWYYWYDHVRISLPHNAPPLNYIYTSISVQPDKISVAPAGTQQFVATALDQYGHPMVSQPAFTWSVSGGGSINSTGLFTAGNSTGGPYTVTASADGKSGTIPFSVGDAVGKGAFIGTYFRNKDLTDPVLSRLDQTINFSWGGGVPDPLMPKDSFSVRWEGDFTFPSAGTFPFTATADDGIRVYLDGTMIINQWKNQVATTYSVNQTVTAGTHRIKVEYYDWKYDAVCKVSFTGAAQAAIANRPVSNSKLSIDLLRQSGNSLEFGVAAVGKEYFDLSITGADGRKIWKSRSHADVRSVFCNPAAANGLYFVTLKQGAHQVIRKIAVMR